MRMTAFPYSGHSIPVNSGNLNVRFRPTAIIEKPRHEGGASDYRDDSFDSIVAAEEFHLPKWILVKVLELLGSLPSQTARKTKLNCFALPD